MKFYLWKEENVKIFKVEFTIFSVYFSRNYSKIILGVLCYVLYTNETTSKLEYFYKKLDKNLF